MKQKLSPSVRKLIAHKMTADAIPVGGGIADGVAYLAAPGLGTRAAEAAQWVQAAIQAVKDAPDNTFGDDEEAIAAEILRRIEERLTNAART